MANLRVPITEEELKKRGLAKLRDDYRNITKDYNKILDRDYLFCHKCNKYLADDTFYLDNNYDSGYFPICKKCLINMACDYDSDTGAYIDNREKTKRVFQMMDLPFIDSLYKSVLVSATEKVGERNKNTAYGYMITCVKSLPNYKGMKWKDSVFDDISEDEEEINENSRTLKQAKKRFGLGYSAQDLMFLEAEYQDWITRYACESKAQELLFKRICFKELDIDKAQKAGKDTKELDKTLQDLMGSMSLKPNQNNSNALTESKTFGQLIAKWEVEKPIPEPDEEFKSVNKIGKYLDVFFKGHLSKMMGLKNAFSQMYDRYMKEFTVNKPEYDEDTDSESLFNQIFGTTGEE